MSQVVRLELVGPHISLGWYIRGLGTHSDIIVMMVMETHSQICITYIYIYIYAVYLPYRRPRTMC